MNPVSSVSVCSGMKPTTKSILRNYLSSRRNQLRGASTWEKVR